ncbi:hypothetical protein KR018_012081 [Drosophila ironensis]|nr:hypothetical protein KR018_012081 [Drosophila ironensis]
MPVRLSSAQSLKIKWIDCPPLHAPQRPRNALRLLRPPPAPNPNQTKNSSLLPFRLPLLLLLLLLLGPAPGQCVRENCSFIEGHILQYVCQSNYKRETRLAHKDRIAAIGTPYVIWKRSDTEDASYLLISFYESPLFSCFTVVMSDGKFYCDGRNFEEPQTRPLQLHCINFPFHYTTDLYDFCSKSRRRGNTQPISVAIAYMKENIKRTSEAGPRLACSAALLLLVFVLVSRLFGILLSQ